MDQAAQILQVNRKTVMRMIAEGRLVASDVGSGGRHSWRIPRSALAEIAAPAMRATSVLPPPRKTPVRATVDRFPVAR